MQKKEIPNADFQTQLQAALDKLSSLHTSQKGLDEIKALLQSQGQFPRKVDLFLSAISTSKAHVLSNQQKKEFIKLYGVLAEELEAETLKYFPKIVAALNKKIREEPGVFHEAISFSFAMLVHNTLHTLQNVGSACQELNKLLRGIFWTLSNSGGLAQQAAALSLTKVIQHSPVECLNYSLEKLANKILEVLQVCKCPGEVLEGLTALVLSVEKHFESLAKNFVPLLLKLASNSNVNTRKQSVQMLYTLASIVPQGIQQEAPNIMNVLQKTKSDRAKAVREISAEAITVFKEKFNFKEEKKHQKRNPSVREANPNFFKAAEHLKKGDLVEVPENQPSKSNLKTSPKLLTKAVPEESKQVKFAPEFVFVEKPQQAEPDMFVEDIEEPTGVFQRIQEMETRNRKLKEEFKSIQESTTSHIEEMKEKVNTLEEVVRTVSQLFEAKLKNIMTYPKIAELLSNEF